MAPKPRYHGAGGLCWETRGTPFLLHCCRQSLFPFKEYCHFHYRNLSDASSSYDFKKLKYSWLTSLSSFWLYSKVIHIYVTIYAYMHIFICMYSYMCVCVYMHMWLYKTKQEIWRHNVIFVKKILSLNKRVENVFPLGDATSGGLDCFLFTVLWGFFFSLSLLFFLDFPLIICIPFIRTTKNIK